MKFVSYQKVIMYFFLLEIINRKFLFIWFITMSSPQEVSIYVVSSVLFLLLMIALGLPRFIWWKKILKVYPLKSFQNMIKNNSMQTSRCFQSTNGWKWKYIGHVFGLYFQDNGIIHQNSHIDTPQQNGVTKRKNKHLLEVAYTLMFSTNISKHF